MNSNFNPILEAIGQRVSSPKLIEPAPSQAELEYLFEASLRVPDHKQLRPWRFLQIKDDGLRALGALFAEAYKRKHPEASDSELDAKQAKAQRAPLIIIGICSYQVHEKVPEFEQQISTGCVLHNLGLGLRSLGYASIWRTGDFAFDPYIKTSLGLQHNESIMGYLYVGTSDSRDKNQRALNIADYLQSWP